MRGRETLGPKLHELAGYADTRIRGYAIKLRETQNMKHDLHFEPQTDETTRYTFTVLFVILYFNFTYSKCPHFLFKQQQQSYRYVRKQY